MIFPGDVIIKNCIELSLDDMKKNPYLIDDVFSDFIENPALVKKYGVKEMARAKEFILNNNINIYMAGRLDKEEFPAITISVGQSSEDKSLSTLGDLSVDIETLEPCDINKKISFIIPPFTPISYDKSTGIIKCPENLENYEYIRSGMVIIDPATGIGFNVLGTVSNDGIQIAIGSDLDGDKVAVVPEYQIYRARRERAISQETYNIGCHTHGDPSTAIFLFAVVKYSLYRYRESLLEHENFQLTTLQASEMIQNQAFETENIYSRFITLTGQCEESWMKTPYRVIEAVQIEGVGDLPGIKIISQKAPDTIIAEDETWITIDGDE